MKRQGRTIIKSLMIFIMIVMCSIFINISVSADNESEKIQLDFDYKSPTEIDGSVVYAWGKDNSLSEGTPFADGLGTVYEGLGMWRPSNDADDMSSATYDIPETATVFEAKIFTSIYCSNSDTEFRVLVDGSQVFSKSIESDNATTATKITVDIPANSKKITLQIRQYDFFLGTEGVVWGDLTFYHTHIKSNGEVIRNATCYQTGIRHMVCSLCGADMGNEEMYKTDHTPDGRWIITTEPTCTTTGERVQHCSVCGEIVLPETLELLPHETGEEVVISGNMFLPPIVRESVCKICGAVFQTKDWSFVWVSPLIIAGVIILICILKSVSVKLRRSKRFVCPYCQGENHVTDVDFKCINPDCNHIFNATKNSGKIPQFAECPRCHKRTSELLCPRCRKLIPETTVFPKGR